MNFKDIYKSEKGMSKVTMILLAIIVILIAVILFYGVQLLSRIIGNSNEKEAQTYADMASKGGTGSSSQTSKPKEENNKKQEENKSLIGRYVDYVPTVGTYNEITNNEKYTGTNTNTEDFKTDNFGWKIWSMDNKKLVLIADRVTTIGGKNGKLILDNSIGYNNGVKLLNDICNSCYSNNDIGAVARSINIEDVESVLNKEVWKPENYFYELNDKEYHTYSGSKVFTTNKTYPYIHQFEEYSNIDNSKLEKGQGITRSEQENLYSGEIYNTYEATSALSPVMTYWMNSFTDKNFINALYYNLLFKDVSGYWLASRCVGGGAEYAFFALQYVANSKVDAYPLEVSKGNIPLGSIDGYKVRPMVEIDLTKVKLDTKSGTGESIEKAYKIEMK